MHNGWKSAAVAAIVAALVAAPLVAGGPGGSSTPGSNAANKASVAGSSVEFLSPAFAGNSGTTSATVLSTTIKTSSTQDLVFSLTMECALWTSVATIGNQQSESTARVVAWVEFDGKPVPVSADDAEETGKVVFCDRTHRQTVNDLDDEDARIEQYLATRSANAFNWVIEDAGSATHTVAVRVSLEGAATDLAFAQAAVGHRTLVVEPIQLLKGSL